MHQSPKEGITHRAQLLMASQLRGVTPLEIITLLYYPMLLGLFGVLAIPFRYSRKYA